TYSVCKNHGYIAGEVWECPCCHEETEVYSRITGYYRPVKNWNEGKAQEFKDRTVYNVGASKLVKGDASVAAAAQAGAVVAKTEEVAEIAQPVQPEKTCVASVLPEGLYMVATHTCPNCKHAEQLLDEAGVAHEVLLAEENQELARHYNIMQAPTLLEVSAQGQARIISGAAAVFKEINALVKVHA
ncbi:MAG: anaerobic ribonucleoside-triphosphate reductase, partial [Raoultibacter sp.]